MLSDDPHATLETPEAGNRAMRLVHARRGNDDVYRRERLLVLDEIWVEADGDLERVVWATLQLSHALARIASKLALIASTHSGDLMSPVDALAIAGRNIGDEEYGHA